MPKEMYAVVPSFKLNIDGFPPGSLVSSLPLVVMSFETYKEALAHIDYTLERMPNKTFTLSIKKCTIHDEDCDA
ncbi:MAG: hypothetical protein ACTSV7_06330 [Candidatus Baldrarchaeia archaeon]